MISPKSVQNLTFSLLIGNFVSVLHFLHVQYIIFLTMKTATSAIMLQLLHQVPHELSGVWVCVCSAVQLVLHCHVLLLGVRVLPVSSTDLIPKDKTTN